MSTIKSLPNCWWITPDIDSVEHYAYLSTLLDQRIEQGISHIQFRQTLLNNIDFQETYHRFSMECMDKDVLLIVNGTSAQMDDLGAKGCYLSSSNLMTSKTRPISKEYWLGAYCHNLDELKHAEQIGIDFVSLSPVKRTKCHPAGTPLGWDTFAELTALVSIPVYALGGLNLSDKEEALKRGGKGIMGIRYDYDPNEWF